MERRISSSFTEFYKIYSILCGVIFFAMLGFPFWDLTDSAFTFLLLLFSLLNLIMAFDFWHMKAVERTDAGLLITDRFFFTQKTIFVPYEQIESAESKLWWLGNHKRISIKFTQNAEFGDRITFISKGMTLIGQAEILEEINREINDSKKTAQINSAFNHFIK